MDAPDWCSSIPRNLLHRGVRPHMASDGRIIHYYLGAGAVHPITSHVATATGCVQQGGTQIFIVCFLSRIVAATRAGFESFRSYGSKMATRETTRKFGITAAFGIIAIGFASSTLVTPLYAFYQKQFLFSVAMLTFIYAAYAIGNFIGLLFLGRMSDRLGRRPVAFAALAMIALTTLLFLSARSVEWLIAGRIASGLAVGLGSGTGTAWLADLYVEDNGRATLLATQANLGGVGIAPLLAGLLAAFAPLPLLLPFIVFFAGAVIAFILVSLARETVIRQPLRREHFKPRLALPKGSRASFVAPAVTAFVTFSFVGFYASLMPTLLADTMRIRNPAVGGVILAELFGIAVLGATLTRSLSSRLSMLCGLASIFPSLALLILAQKYQSLALLVCGTAWGGVTIALGHRGALAVVNQIAPPASRAGLASIYFVTCFLGNSLPIMGVGLLSILYDPITATECFAALMFTLAVGGFLSGLRFVPPVVADQVTT